MNKVAIFGLVIGLAACNQGEGPAGAGSSAPAAGGKATTSLTRAQLEEAEKLTDPDKFDASLAAATGKLGKPQKSDATSATWYGVDKTTCWRLVLTKAKGNEIGMTDNASCGLK